MVSIKEIFLNMYKDKNIHLFYGGIFAIGFYVLDVTHAFVFMTGGVIAVLWTAATIKALIKALQNSNIKEVI